MKLLDADPLQVPPSRPFHGVDPSSRHHSVPPPAVHAMERIWADRVDDLSHARLRHRDEVRVAPHEAHVANVWHHRHGVTHQERPPAPGPGLRWRPHTYSGGRYGLGPEVGTSVPDHGRLA